MPFATFEEFTLSLCEAAGVAAPELVPDESGIVAFHLELTDVVVNIVHLQVPQGVNDEAFLLVTFGSIEQGKELEVLRLLAEANFSMLGKDSPVFGLSPATDEVVLRQIISLSQVDGPGTWAAILRLAELARQWRVDPMLAPLQSDRAALNPNQFA